MPNLPNPKMVPRRRMGDALVAEEFKIAVALALKKLTHCDEQKELEFPSSLSSEERKYIHQIAKKDNFKTKSRGKGSSRFITVYKKEGSTIMSNEAIVELGEPSKSVVRTFLQRFPVSNKERQDLLPATERDRLMNPELRDLGVLRSLGRLTPGPPQIPPHSNISEIGTEARKLPTWAMKDQILSAIYHGQVILICGETGSGKTTQVPQMILEEAASMGQPCRIFCTQPRRISALTVAERVAAERGEKVGYTVGYQIRLESKLSPKTLLTFCTNGVLLRTLMGGESALATVTHVLVDEIHERDKFTDFLLVVLRDCLPKFRHLKLILMSASMDVNLYAKYFNNCPVVDVPGKCYPVKEYFLEDILKYTKYDTPKMQKAALELTRKDDGQKTATAWTEQMSKQIMESVDQQIDKKGKPKTTPPPKDMDKTSKDEMDQLIENCFLVGSEEDFSQLLYLIMNENVSVDYQHSKTWASPLMVASGRGRADIVERLLSMGATINLKAANDWTAIDWAESTAQQEILDLLHSYSACEGLNIHSEREQEEDNVSARAGAPLTIPDNLSPEDKRLLDSYNLSIPEEGVDIQLMYALCYKIHTSQPPGAILIFLPGYDDIMSLRERIMSEDKKFSNGGKYNLFCLHSRMQSSDQKRVFKPGPVGVRKIILSTNIAETSVTINDVVYVINSGKVKETSFDSFTGVSSLQAVWACQASVQQRKGRAGRCQPGICYHLISRYRYNRLRPHQMPEILRTPLEELCLHAKLLAPTNMSIADFMVRAPESPAFHVIRSAVQLLKSIDALDGWEDVTELGHHLLDLPLPSRLAKMVITATILKCLDPVLTVASCLAYKDPFILPIRPDDKRELKQVKRKFSAGTYSDHMVLLRAFQAWQKASSERGERSWCHKNFVSGPTMEMIHGMRAQVLAQLRGSGFVRTRGPGDIRDVNSNSDNWAVVKAALVSGMYPNLIRVDREQGQLRTQKESKLRLHPSSALLDMDDKESFKNKRNPTHMKNLIYSLGSDWLVYDEMVRIGMVTHVKNVTVVSPITVLLLAGPTRLPLDALSEPSRGNGAPGDCTSDSENEEKPATWNCLVRLDQWVQFLGDPQAAQLALQLRHKLHALILRRLRAPNKPLSQGDEAVIRMVALVLSQEEQALDLPQPTGVGQRPRPLFSHNNTSEGGAWGGLNTDESSNKNQNNHNKDSNNPNPPFVLTNQNKTNQQEHQNPLLGALTPSNNNNSSNIVSASSGNNSNSEGKNKGGKGGNNSNLNPNIQAKATLTSIANLTSNMKGASISVIKSTAATSTTSTSTSTSGSNKSNASGGQKEGGHGGNSKNKNSHEKKDKSGGGNAKSNNNSSTRYFIIRVNSYKQIEASYNSSVWAFNNNTERKIVRAAQNSSVILVFSLNRGNQFNGVAKFLNQKSDKKCPEITYTNNNATLFKVDWLKKGNVNFHQTRHLYNPCNDNLQVHVGPDGQEVESSVGEQLVEVWDKQSSDNNHSRKNDRSANNQQVPMMHDPTGLRRGLHHMGPAMHHGMAQFHRGFRGGYGNGGFPLNYTRGYRPNGAYRR